MKQFTITILTSLLLVFCWSIDHADAQTINALYMTGGGYHDYEAQLDVIVPAMEERLDIEWTVDFEAEGSNDHMHERFQTPGWIDEFDVVVYNNCHANVTDVDFIDSITQAHADSGVGAVFLHCSMHTYRATETDSWNQLIGIETFNHERRRESYVNAVNLSHPVMEGFPEGGLEWPSDELYMVLSVSPNVVPLTMSYGPDTENWHIRSWVNTYGEARVAGNSAGHTAEAMAMPEYLNFVENAIEWVIDN